VATQAEQHEAIAVLVGACCYALLRSFEITARAVADAPTPTDAQTQAEFAVEEFDRYRQLRARLGELTDGPDEAMQATRPALDAFYNQARTGGWLEAQVFHFVGDTVTADFADMIAPHLDAETAEAARRALTGRTKQQAFALAEISEALSAEDSAAQERIARFAGNIVGAALNRLREALEDNDALEIILGEGGVKGIVLEILGRHRERLERLEIEPVDG